MQNNCIELQNRCKMIYRNVVMYIQRGWEDRELIYINTWGENNTCFKGVIYKMPKVGCECFYIY